MSDTGSHTVAATLILAATLFTVTVTSFVDAMTGDVDISASKVESYCKRVRAYENTINLPEAERLGHKNYLNTDKCKGLRHDTRTTKNDAL